MTPPYLKKLLVMLSALLPLTLCKDGPIERSTALVFQTNPIAQRALVGYDKAGLVFGEAREV